jgi:hypothetical protein
VARPAYKLTAPIVPEHPRQAEIARVLTIEIAPAGKVSDAGVCWFSIDHANYAGEVPGVRIGRGIIAGVLDTLVLYRGRTHWIEIKTPDGELSDPQRSVIAAVVVGGSRVAVARDWIEVLACLDEWAIPRKRRIRETA